MPLFHAKGESTLLRNIRISRLFKKFLIVIYVRLVNHPVKKNGFCIPF
jgi:hypothetical protein